MNSTKKEHVRVYVWFNEGISISTANPNFDVDYYELTLQYGKPDFSYKRVMGKI